jgi:HK97 gp10 family phage protein
MATTSRPNDADAIAGHIRGLREAKAAFQALPEIEREARLDAVTITAQQIVRHAQAHLRASPSIQTRALLNAVGFQVTKTNGRARVGIMSVTTTIANLATRTTVKVKGIIRQSSSGRQTIDKPSRRAHFIEFGTRRQPAEPFMKPAADKERQPYIARVIAGGKKIERDMAAIGSRNL